MREFLGFSLLLFLFLLVHVFGLFSYRSGLDQGALLRQSVIGRYCASQFHARHSIIFVLLLAIDKVANLVEDVAEHGLALAFLLAIEEDG